MSIQPSHPLVNTWWCVWHRSPPNIYWKKKKTGGVSINSTLPLTKMDEKLILRVLQEYKIHNCEVSLLR
jgi:ribosome-interacting GTPase 1